METRTVSMENLFQATQEVADTLAWGRIEHATIEYFFTILDGKPAHTFKITYEQK